MRLQSIADKIMLSFLKLTKHKNSICIYSILNEDNDKMYFFFFTNAIDYINDKVVHFINKRKLNDGTNKYDFVILYEGVEYAKKNDIKLTIVDVNTVKITFYITSSFEYNKNFQVYFNKNVTNDKCIKINDEKYKTMKTQKNKT